MDTADDNQQLRLIDIAVNLTDGMFRGNYRGKQMHQDDFSLVMERAAAAGVEHVIATGTSLESSAAALDLAMAGNSPVKISCTVGCHPTEAGQFEAQGATSAQEYLDSLLSLALRGQRSGHVVAIGECGLDYDRLHFCPAETQRKYFEMQFRLAEETRLPMFLHSRNAHDDMIRMLRDNRHRFPGGGVVHSFTGTKSELKEILDLDLYVGVNGCSLRSEDGITVVKQIPDDRLLLETDAPWCEMRQTHASFGYIAKQQTLPQTVPKPERFQRGHMVRGRNEPACLRRVLDVVAAIRGASVSALSRVIYDNTRRLFSL